MARKSPISCGMGVRGVDRGVLGLGNVSHVGAVVMDIGHCAKRKGGNAHHELHVTSADVWAPGIHVLVAQCIWCDREFICEEFKEKGGCNANQS